MDKLTIRDVDASGKRVFVRVDFNVPLQDGKVTDDSRIRASIPTIRALLGQGARVILASHLGRPDGKVQDGLRLRPVAERLSQLLRLNVPCTGDALGLGTEDAVRRLRPGEALLLENLRFHVEEEKNDPAFAQALADYADLYVNDAFGTAHRAHASTVGIAKLLPAYAGLLMEAEIKALSGLLEQPERPFAAVVGGAKVSGKIEVLTNLMDKVDLFVVGGGMANTFLVAQGKSVGKSLAEYDRVDDAKRILAMAESKGVRIVLPIDVIVAKEVTQGTEYKTLLAEKIPASWHIVDVGKQSLAAMEEALEPARTVFWNGPLGVFEIPSFAQGTRAMARFLADKADWRCDRRRRRRRLGGGRPAAGPGRADDPYQHRRRRVARIPRGPRAAGHRRPAGPPDQWNGEHVSSTFIAAIDAREILDSRGNPTIEVDVILDDGSVGRAAVPVGRVDGRQRGGRAARRRQGPLRRQGRPEGRRQRRRHDRAGARGRGRCRPGSDRRRADRARRDRRTRAISGRTPSSACRSPAPTPRPRRTTCRSTATSAASGRPRCRSRSSTSSTAASTPSTRPTSRSSWSPRSASPPTPDALRAGAEVFAALRGILHDGGFAVGQGDEGGFAPSLPSNEAAVEVILRAIEKAGYRPGEQIAIALDPAASSFLVEGTGSGGVPGRYRLEREDRTLDSAELIELWATWIAKYPIVSLEDGLAEDDWPAWQELTARLGDRVQLVGDDLLVTNPAFIARGIEERAANSVLIKLNQIGTLTETIAAIDLARRAGWTAMVSHRSGETEDTTIADFVVAMGIGQIKTGAPSRSERVAKYNRLLRIDGELGSTGRYLGRAALAGGR